MWIKSDVDKYISTTWGSTVILVAGEPKEVGHDIGLLCMQNGCTEVHNQPKEVSVKETPVIAEEIKEVIETVSEEASVNFEDMTKGQLEDYGRTVGIELDKRKKKSVLIDELKAIG